MAEISYTLNNGEMITNDVVDGFEKVVCVVPEGYKVCNQCMFNKVKPSSDFDEGRKSCRSCLERRRQKMLCPCGGTYSKSAISHHRNTKMHQEWELLESL